LEPQFFRWLTWVMAAPISWSDFAGGIIFLKLRTVTPALEQRLTEDQKRWHKSWAGQVCIVRSPEEAIKAISI
jgi:hypothetical protein